MFRHIFNVLDTRLLKKVQNSFGFRHWETF